MLHRPPKRKPPTTLRNIAFNKTVQGILSGSIPAQQLGATLPPLLREQVSRQVKRTTKRARRQQKLYKDYENDIEKLLKSKKPQRIPFYLFKAFCHIVEGDMNNDILFSFRDSNRKFQKLGKFDPIDYEEGIGKYELYFVKHNGDVFLCVYDFEKELIMALCVDHVLSM